MCDRIENMAKSVTDGDACQKRVADHSSSWSYVSIGSLGGCLEAPPLLPAWVGGLCMQLWMGLM